MPGKGCIVSLGILGVLAIFALIIISMIVGTLNREADLRTQVEAKQKDNTSEFDNMWKKITQISQVSTEAATKLKEIFVDYADARSGKDSNNQLLMKWISESCPNVSPDSLPYKQLMNVIEGSRDRWTMQQKILIDLHRELMLMYRKFPSNIILSMFGRKPIDIIIVTSSKTEKAFEEGKDDDVDLFPKKE